jgi:outer membrane protein assembly factor BamB
MARRTLPLALALAVLATGLFALQGQEPKSAVKPAKPDKKDAAQAEAATDLLTTAKEWNSAKFASPPTTFRKGHVKPRALPARAVAATKNGFVVSLPSKAPIPTPSVYQGKVYVSGGFHSKEYYCFDANNGKLVWGVNLDDDGPTSAVCGNGTVVFNTESCTIFALDARTGKQLWSWWLGDPLTSTPAIANGKVFTSYPSRGNPQALNAKGAPRLPAPKGGKPAPPCSHVLAALDLKTGKILWQRWIDSDVMSAPICVDREVYATSFAGVVYKFSQDDGTILSAVRSRATSAPVVVGKQVFFTRRADDGKGKAAEAVVGGERASLKERFAGDTKAAPYLDKEVQNMSKLKAQSAKLDAANGFAFSPAAANAAAGYANIGQANVYSLQAFQGSRILNYRDHNFNCMGDEVVCTDPVSGKAKWTFKLEGDLKKEGGFLAAPPAAAGGQLFLTTLKGEVLQMGPETGKVANRYKVGSPLRFQPAIENGKVYVGTQDGKLVCIDTGDRRFTGWSCWGGNAAHTGAPAAKADK